MALNDAQAAGPRWFLAKSVLGDIVTHLQKQGYRVIGPKLKKGVVALGEIHDAKQMVCGKRDVQDGGVYRLEDGEGGMHFEHVVGPDSAKRYFFPPRLKLFTLHVEGDEFAIDDVPPQPEKLAFIGLRSCELAAIGIQDRVFGVERGQSTPRCESETYYRQARENALLIAVNCTRPGGTCFCASMGTGPEATEGYDLAITELKGGFVARVGTEKGQAVLDRLAYREATETELELEQMKLQQAAEHMGRTMDCQGVADLLTQAVEHPRWKQTASRCLSCGNCTMVCPTCFCSTVVDSTEPGNPRTTRTRQWESCFTHQFSYTTAGPVRNTIGGRYRHWLRHKLGTWWEQFGTSGCVGCGRCITWCPVGIDLTEEVAAIREHAGQAARSLVESEVRS